MIKDKNLSPSELQVMLEAKEGEEITEREKKLMQEMRSNPLYFEQYKLYLGLGGLVTGLATGFIGAPVYLAGVAALHFLEKYSIKKADEVHYDIDNTPAMLAKITSQIPAANYLISVIATAKVQLDAKIATINFELSANLYSRQGSVTIKEIPASYMDTIKNSSRQIFSRLGLKDKETQPIITEVDEEKSAEMPEELEMKELPSVGHVMVEELTPDGWVPLRFK